MAKVITAFITLIILLSIDYPVFKSIINTINPKKHLKKIIAYIYWTISIFIYIEILIYTFFKPYKLPYSLDIGTIIIFINGFIFAIFFLKIMIFTGILLNKIISKITKPIVHNSLNKKINIAFLLLSVIIALIIIFKFYVMPNNYSVNKIEIYSKDIPPNFNNFKLLVFSDLHTGSIINKENLKIAINKINELNPDIIFFLGDMVNYHSNEALKYETLLKNIKIPAYGIYTIMGNHDYGYYTIWKNTDNYLNNIRQLFKLYENLNWHILLNQNHIIKKGSQQIAILGVENYSNPKKNKKYKNRADIKKAITGVENNQYIILLTHDPDIWKDEVIKKYKNIDLTIAGHTHAMQFGFQIKNYKWSPAKYFYNQWYGLYYSKDSSQTIYVTRGIGNIGFPGRLGMPQEITIITLHNKK